MAGDSRLHVIIASVGEKRYDSEVVSATFPGDAGVLTVLPHHEPLVTTLRRGTITVRPNASESRDFEREGGVLEVSGNRAIVLL